MGHTARRFPDLQAFWNHVSKPDKGRLRSMDGDAKFHGTKTFDAAMELARNGWSEGVESIKPLAARLSSRLSKAVGQPEPVYDVVGGSVDVGAYLSGEPEHMIDFRAQENSRIARIVVGGFFSWNVQPDVILRRGAVICAMIDAAESAGIRCEVTLALCVSGYNSGSTWTTYVTVKRPDEPLNLDRLAFILLHRAMFRRVGFRAMELEPVRTLRDDIGVGTHYGFHADVPKDERGDIYITGMCGSDPRWQDDGAAESAALDMLKAAGVEIKEG